MLESIHTHRFVNPFRCPESKCEELLALHSGQPLDPVVANDVLRSRELGVQAMDAFIRERLRVAEGHTDPLVPFGSPVKRKNLKTGVGPTTGKRRRRAVTDAHGTFDAGPFVVALLYATNLSDQSDKLHDLATFQCSAVPAASFKPDGSPRKVQKTMLWLEWFVADDVDFKDIVGPHVVIIYDGNAKLHTVSYGECIGKHMEGVIAHLMSKFEGDNVCIRTFPASRLDLGLS